MEEKYEVDKFDGQNSFSLWHLKIRALLIQQGLYKALIGNVKLPVITTKDDREELNIKALNAIQSAWPMKCCMRL